MGTSKQDRLENFLRKANKVHNSRFKYDQESFVNSWVKMRIFCPEHGEFLQAPEKHAAGQGCPSCRGNRISKTKQLPVDQFIQRAKEIHNSLYDYSEVIYINAHSKVKIICPNHGPFLITPNNHIYGTRAKGGKIGCPAHSNNVSYAGQEWLDSFKNQNIVREHIIWIEKKKFKCDGFDPETNTVYEYFGNFWHGNPDLYNKDDVNPRTGTKFGELFAATLRKIDTITQAGYRIVYEWGP